MVRGWAISARAVGSLVKDDVVDEGPGLAEVDDDANLQGGPGLNVPIPGVASQAPQ